MSIGVNSIHEDRTFQLTIWHPLALPSDMQNREGCRKLSDVFYAYPDNPTRRGREKAIKSIRAFLKEAERLIATEDADFHSVGAALHIHFYLLPDAGIRTAGTIAQSAQRHGLACYCPSIDRLTLPSSLGSSPALNSNKVEATIPDEQAIVVQIGPWVLRAYVETTRTRYAKIKQSGSEHCGCDNCTNFSRARGEAYPPEVLTVIHSLGIDFKKESEVHYYGRTEIGLHTYRGWFYVVGSIEQGPQGEAERHFHQLGPTLKIGLGRKSKYGYAEWETVLIAAGFAKFPCVEVDFYVDLPWLSDAVEPARRSSQESNA